MAKTVIITGASGGIGKATAAEFGKYGYSVLCCYRNNEAGALDACRLVKEAGGEALPFQMDITSHADCRRTVAKALMSFGGVDVLVNNAGIAQTKLFSDTTEDDYDRLFSANMKGMFFLSQAAAKEMRETGGGSIVNVSSMWGIVGASMEVAYSASKAAVIGFTKALAKELAPAGIRVNCVAPGVIDTEMNRCHSAETMQGLAARTPLSRLGIGEDVAKCIRFLADEATFVTGEVLRCDGGFIL